MRGMNHGVLKINDIRAGFILDTFLGSSKKMYFASGVRENPNNINHHVSDTILDCNEIRGRSKALQVLIPSSIG
jgi:hypothetical protein